MQLASTLRSSTRVPFLQIVKVVIATVAAWLITPLILPGPLPIFATIAALLVVQPTVNQTLGRAIERSIGVIVGVAIAYGIGAFLGQSSWIVLLVLVVAILISWLLKLTPGTSNQVPISAMLVLAIGATTPNYAFDRVIETIIGAVIGLIVTLAIVPPVLLAPAHDAVLRLTNEIASTMDEISAALSGTKSNTQLNELLITARLLKPMQDKAAAALKEGQDSLILNPRRSRRRDVLAADAALFARLGPIITRVVGMTRAVRDHYEEDLPAEPAVGAIAIELSRAAHDLRLLASASSGVGGQQPVAVEPAALTAPLVLVRPTGDHWILIGALMEDLRRVREEIVGE